MTNPNTTPEAVPAPVHVDTTVAPATDTAVKGTPSGGEHEVANVEPTKS